MPTVDIQGGADPDVLISVSRELKAEAPSLDQFAELPSALPAKSWNYDSRRDDQLVGQFLSKLGPPRRTTGPSGE